MATLPSECENGGEDARCASGQKDGILAARTTNTTTKTANDQSSDK
jgi:hypothetical protein